MANEEQVAILRQGAARWNQWRKESLNTLLDLRHADLRNADLSDTDLRDADLSGALLRFADLRNANLRQANLSSADLRNADLVNTDLGEAELHGADLSGAILNSADLSGANLKIAGLRATVLRNANLRAVDLRMADLARADLRDANLRNAQLAYADLSGTDVSGAHLNGTDLSHAVLNHTIFADVALSEVEGLETVRHIGPSSIGIDTIYNSKGKIPADFLRGCGVPDIFIEYMAVLTRNPFAFYSCFISYCHADQAFAHRLHDTLQGKGVRCWLDEKDARLGVPLAHNIEHGIRLTEKFLLCCSQESLRSGWVNFEIDLALHREQELRHAMPNDTLWRIIPLDLDGHLFSPDYQGDALRIKNRLAGDFTNWKTDSDKFDREVARLIQAIRIEGST